MKENLKVSGILNIVLASIYFLSSIFGGLITFICSIFLLVSGVLFLNYSNLKDLSDNVKYLFSIGFKTINLLFNFKDNWEDKDLSEIKKQYNKLEEIYCNKILAEDDVSILLFDEKIESYVKPGFDCKQKCEFALKNVNIGTDGKIYPCMQFVGNEDFIIGDCLTGIDISKRTKLLKEAHQELDICKNCSFNKRCTHTCCCVNYLATSNINQISPIVCETEKLAIETADTIASKLYKQKSKLFLQKYYNDKYTLLKGFIENKK